MTPLKNNSSGKLSREHQANERTFLAWVRTGIALMGFGFVIVKFSLFLKQMAILMGTHAETNWSSGVAGVLMVAVGVLVTLFAYFQFKKSEQQIENQQYGNRSFLTLFITLVMTIGGVALTIYLLAHL